MRSEISILFVLVFFLSCAPSRNINDSTKSRGSLDFRSPEVVLDLKDDNTFAIDQYSQDPDYGYSAEKPVMVGGVAGGPRNERRFLNALTGPNGEELRYERLGSCCQFKTRHSPFEDIGLLDRYEVVYVGSRRKMIIYFNMYDSDTLKVPVGLGLKK